MSIPLLCVMWQHAASSREVPALRHLLQFRPLVTKVLSLGSRLW